MKLSAADLSELADVAISAATQAGQMIASSRPGKVEHKTGGASLERQQIAPSGAVGAADKERRNQPGGRWARVYPLGLQASQVVTEIDRQSEDIIVDMLTPTLERFGLGLLTEERDDDGGRLAADNFWCIDPLDGTLPFIEGSPGYAVSIALVGRNGAPRIGVVYDPVEATVMHAISRAGAFRDGRRWMPELGSRVTGTEVLSVFADRSFLTQDDHDELVDSLDQIARDMGLSGLRVYSTSGAVMNACAVLANAPACYFKYPKPTGGGSLWDFAATACLFREVGAVATDIYGDALDLNRADSTFMNHRGVLFATDPALAARIRKLRQG